MNEINEMWRACKAQVRETRAKRLLESTKAITRMGVAFESKNHGQHLVLRHFGHVIDFWPGTGKWRSRTAPHRGSQLRTLQQILGSIAIEDGGAHQ